MLFASSPCLFFIIISSLIKSIISDKIMSKRNIKITPVKKNGKNGSSVLGPVDNLELHLRPDWWRRIFNSMYLKTDADVVEDKTITVGEVELFSSILNIPRDKNILDLA